MKNAKQADANTRLPLHLCPPVLQVRVAAVMKAALRKPGRYPYNYQETSSLITYMDAAKRHIAKLEDGEWIDEDSQEPHAACIAANMAVILHCELKGTLERDLPGETGKLSALIDAYQDKYKAELSELHPGVVKFEDGKDCGDPDCKASECLHTRMERIELSQEALEKMAHLVENPPEPSESLKAAAKRCPVTVPGWACTRDADHEGPHAAVMTECVCDASGVSPTTPCTGCPRWNGTEPEGPVLDTINQVTPRKCKKFSCGNNAYMAGDLCYDCIPF